MNNVFPFGIQYFDIELNTKCNARCSYCRIFNQNFRQDSEEMPFEVLSDFYSKLIENPPEDFYSIDFSETEPLLSFHLIKKIFETYPIERKNRFFHSITTNGKSLNKEILDFCADHDIVLKISLDGTPENCKKEKGINLEELKNILKQMKKKNLLAFNYVITMERLDFLEEDLSTIFNFADEFNTEWSFLLNVLTKWPEDLFEIMIKKVASFLEKHYNKRLSYFLRSVKKEEPRMTGIGVRVNGELTLMPANHTCKQPVDQAFLENFCSCGTLKNINEAIIQSYLNKYGLNYSKTNFVNLNCKSCLNYEKCHPTGAKENFQFSDEDCLANNYQERIWRILENNNFNYEEAKKNFRISSACLALTNQCNMRCRYCFTSPNSKTMDLSTAISAIMWIKQNQGKVASTHVNFFGGEPMLRYEEIIKPLVEWTEKMGITGITYGMTTNGTLFNEERLKWLRQHNISILLSIDGGPETQNYNRRLLNGEDSFLKVVENIPLLLAYNPKVTFRSTVYPDTVEYTFENYLWAKELGFQSFFLMPDEFSEWSDKKIAIFVEQLNKIYWEHYNLITKKEKFPAMKDFFTVLYELMGFPLRDKDNLYMRCGLGTTGVGIGTNGDIYGCQEHLTYDHNSPFFIGNIFKGGFDEDRRERLIRLYLEGAPGNCDLCPSHCWGVFKNLKDETKIHKIWRETTQLSCIEILLEAAKTNNQHFIDFVKKYDSLGEGL